MGKMRCIKYLCREVEEKGSPNLVIDEMIVLKLILNKYDVNCVQV
jgi:hypothetical protein